MLLQKIVLSGFLACLLLMNESYGNIQAGISASKSKFEELYPISNNQNLKEFIKKDTLAITFGGAGFYPVEFDGYGLAKETHWPVSPNLPFSSPALPVYYIENGSPVAYLIGSYPEVKMDGIIKEEITGKGVLVGRSSKINFLGEVILHNGSFKARVRSTSPLPSSIDCWENLKIQWELTLNKKVFPLGTSQNSIYTILQEPITSLIHTPLHIAATAGRGLVDTLEITKKIWQRFKDQEVLRVWDKKPMTYYKLYEDKAPAELRSMLVAGSGQCVAWSYLLYSTLGSQGIHSEIITIMPPGKGRLFVKEWRFIEGEVFINTGKNGVNETDARGDDIQILKKGNGQPYTNIWKSNPLKTDSYSLDDLPEYKTGPNGIVDTRIDESKAIPTIPYKFGLPNQRVYVIQSADSVGEVKLGGDDIIVRQIKTYYVLSGPNGIVETPMQNLFLKGKDGKPHPFVSWIPKMGTGANHINFTYAVPMVEAVPDVKGDDIKNDWWINSGANGISETPGANYNHGKSFSVAIGPGVNGELNSMPGGDDSIIDLRNYMTNAPEGFTFIYPFNMWPVPGLSGQNNSNPPTDYPNHVIVKSGGKYFDPSYGAGPFDSQLDWEKGSIVGVGQQMRDSNNEFIRFDNKIMFFVKPMQGNQIITQFMTTLSPN